MIEGTTDSVYTPDYGPSPAGWLHDEVGNDPEAHYEATQIAIEAIQGSAEIATSAPARNIERIEKWVEQRREERSEAALRIAELGLNQDKLVEQPDLGAREDLI